MVAACAVSFSRVGTSRTGPASAMKAGEPPATFNAWPVWGAIESEAPRVAWSPQHSSNRTPPEPGCGWPLQPEEQQSDGETHASAGSTMPRRHAKSISAATSRGFTGATLPAAPNRRGASEIRSAIPNGESSPWRAPVRSFLGRRGKRVSKAPGQERTNPAGHAPRLPETRPPCLGLSSMYQG